MQQGWKGRVIAIIATLLAWLMFVSLAVSASDEPAQSFAGCVVRGGEVRRIGDDIACRHITTYTMRTYLSGKTECGEEVEYEIWDVVRYGTVSWLFASKMTVDLPEVGETWPEAPATPVPCLDGDP